MSLNARSRGAGKALSAQVAKPPPARTCLGCQQTRPKSLLFRLVCAPTGQLLLDPQGKLPGRGVYLCPQRSCAERALRGTRWREALRREVSLCTLDELVQALAQAMEDRALAYIRLARKAGRLVSGYSQVKRALMSAPVAYLLIAEDVAGERRHEYVSWAATRQIPYRSFLTKARLGELAGRDESSAVGILDIRLAEPLAWLLGGMQRLAER
jgi:predicted RNA-binding protein YlxR (DUF448 family)/ribosomal protein L30E